VFLRHAKEFNASKLDKHSIFDGLHTDIPDLLKERHAVKLPIDEA
jgi:hypothetical protein